MWRRIAAVAVLVLAAACSPQSTESRPPVSATTGTAPGFAVTQGIGDPLNPALGNPGYDVAHYDIRLTYDPKARTLDGEVTLTATATAVLDSVNVDFIGFQVDRVTVDGRPAEFARTDVDMTVRLPARLPTGREFHLAVRYHGTPETIMSDAGSPAPLGWVILDERGSSYVMAEPDGARAWFPCNDVPSDKATYTFRITVPAGYLAAANGVLADPSTTAAGGTWRWEMTDPMATYLATVVVSSDYALVDDGAGSAVAGLPIRNFLPPQMADDPALERQGEMIAYFRGLFGPFPFDTYGVAYAPGFPGAMETQTLTLLGMRSEAVVVHELSHSWFGDWVSPMHWNDIWLNEGFATYAEWLWSEHAGSATIAQSASDEYAMLATMPAEAISPPGDPPAGKLFNRGVYGRGALTLHALRLRVGDAAFFATLRAWVQRYGGGSATTEDFIALAEEHSGLQLGPLFEAWLHAPAMPPLPGAASPSPPPGSPSSDGR